MTTDSATMPIAPHATETVFNMAEDAARQVLDLVSSRYEGNHTLSDDSCDELTAFMDQLDITTRALRCDYRDQACSLLLAAIEQDDLTLLHEHLPNDFDLLDYSPFNPDENGGF